MRGTRCTNGDLDAQRTRAPTYTTTHLQNVDVARVVGGAQQQGRRTRRVKAHKPHGVVQGPHKVVLGKPGDDATRDDATRDDWANERGRTARYASQVATRAPPPSPSSTLAHTPPHDTGKLETTNTHTPDTILPRPVALHARPPVVQQEVVITARDDQGVVLWMESQRRDPRRGPGQASVHLQDTRHMCRVRAFFTYEK